MTILEDSFITQIQQATVDLLKADSALSAIPIFAENIRDIEFQINSALSKQGIVAIVITPNLTYRGDLNTDNTFAGKKLAFDAEIEVVVTENVTVNRANANSLTCQDVAIKVAEILGLAHHGQYCLKEISTGEDDGLLVSKVTLDCLAIDD